MAVQPSPVVAPYGSWKSPITSDLIASETLKFTDVQVDGDKIYWVEERPALDGRSVVVRSDVTGHMQDVTSDSFNVRTDVHSYGGGTFVAAKGILYFANYGDMRIYRQEGPSTSAVAITPEVDRPPEQGVWYADGAFDPTRDRLICIQEDRTAASGTVVNRLVSIDVTRCVAPEPLVEGNDFYSSPKVSPDGTKLVWLEWSNKTMPWTGTQLWVGVFDARGGITTRQLVAGSDTESVFQPEWSPDNVLHFVSDRRAGWWNLHRWESGQVQCLVPIDAEFGQAQWYFGLSTYGFEEKRIICAYTKDGVWHLASLDRGAQRLTDIRTPYTDFSYVRTGPGFAVARAGSWTEPLSIIVIDLQPSPPAPTLIKPSNVAATNSSLKRYFSSPQHLTFPTDGEAAYAFLYPPENPDYTAPQGERYPLLVTCHGGPTGAAQSALTLTTQYWTSRGVAVLDVNYRGSTGYGRAYRDRLKNLWGITDVDDCVNGAGYIVVGRHADLGRLAITGGSAGGYTTLCALTFRAVFKAGASYYGISDLRKLQNTHKFEEHYLDWLIDPDPRSPIYDYRSPVHFPLSITVPVIFFQGAKDPVVPPDQTQVIVNALLKAGRTFGCVLFAGEGHGFRVPQHKKLAIDAEFSFYAALVFRC
jgi:dipeptidyl aminopeptidase/acylaminoacyl peptidase